VTAPLNAQEWEAAAAASLPDAAAAYLFGGAEDERTMRRNREAFERIVLRPRILGGFAEATLATTVLGTETTMPILVAPVGHQRLFHGDGELGTARAAAAAGTVFALSTMANATIEEVAELDGPRWFQLYALHDRGHRRELVARAEAAGYSAILLTVDVQSLGHRERDLRAGFSLPEWLEMPLLVRSREGDLTLHQTSAMLDAALSFADLEEVCGWTSLPVAVKGVLRPDDAVLCAEHGAAGVVVSNHGGRQLDGAIASIEALPAIADEAGDDLEVLLDSGVRRGVDVVAALALGARAVLVGRPVISALAMDGEEAVAALLAQLRAELAGAMHLAGCADVAAVPRDLLG
jgi:4-hydroxymandelate oxidase